LLQALLTRAPNDEGVKQLQLLKSSHSIPASAIPAPLTPKPSQTYGRQPLPSIDVDAVDVVMEEEGVDAPASEAPFVMRPSQAAEEELDPALRLRRVLALVEQFRRAKDFDTAIA